jgi:molecular chaperone DnaK
VLGTAGDSFLGGDDLDERIVDRMVEQFLAEHRVDLRSNEVSMMRLRAVAEQTKIELSRRSRAVVRIDEIAYGPKGKALDLQIEIRRDEFVKQVADIIDRTFPVCEEAMKYANLTLDGIDDVILVGGTTKIPYVRDQVTKFFNKAPRADVSPEDAVALGAALQARALERVLDAPAAARAPSSGLGGETETVTETETDTDTFTRETERKAERGAHHDVFEVATPKPPPPSGAPVLGRLTKPRPPAPPRRPVPQQVPISPPPSPSTTAQGMGVARPDGHLDLDDVSFTNVATEKDLLDLGIPPEATAAPAPPPARAQAPAAPKPTQTLPMPVLQVPGWPAQSPSAATMPSMQAPSPVVLDVTPRGLGIGTVAGFCEELIRRNSRVPTEMRKMFTTSRDDQDAVRIIVVQGESRRMADNTVIADLRLDGLTRRPRGETSIEVTFMIDANGILQVRARDAQTGRDARASLAILGSVPEEDVSASRDRVQQLRR